MKTKIFGLLMTLLLVFGCKEEILLPELKQGTDGISTIFAFDILAPTENHLNGGYAMWVGGDLNGNGTLEEEEVQATVPIWHGNDGINGTDGTNGLDGANGTSVSISEDGYWVLDGVITEFKALGVDGQDGANGQDGKSPIVGEDGYWYVWNSTTNNYETTYIKAEGADGADGATPDIFFLTQDVEPIEGHYNGGILVTMVWDKDGNQEIDEEDILGGYTVWHGNDGANGQNGADGEDGLTPYIGEGGYWWIGEYFTGYKAVGVDGQDGQDGSDGADGFSPYISENGYWVVMINNVIVETEVPATGERGARGYQGEQGERGTVVGYSVSTAQKCDTQGYRVTITIDEGLPSEYVQWFEVCDGKVGATGADGEDGLNSLINVIPTEVEGCIEVQSGLDRNGNGELDENEVTSSQYVCDGADGIDGKDGINGADGTNGVDGEDGYNTIMTVTELENGCVYFVSGIDFNRNGELDENEEMYDASICDGTNGVDGDTGLNSLVEVSNKDEDGCVTIYTGLDLDGDLILDEDEVTYKSTVCDGLNGLNGVDGQDGADGTNGTDGVNGKDGADGKDGVDGVNGLNGLDGVDGVNGLNGLDGINGLDGLDGADGNDGADGTNGTNGLNSLVRIVEGDNGCATIYVGLDVNGNGTLDEGEETSSTVVCDGADGQDGADGADGLVIGECGYSELEYELVENWVFASENFNTDLPTNWIFDNFELKNSNDYLTTTTAFEDYGWRSITTDYLDQVFSLDVASINLRSGLSGTGEQTVRIVLEFERNDGTVIRSAPVEVDINSSEWTPVVFEGESICVRRFSILFEGDEPLEVDDVYVEGTKVSVINP